MNIFEKIALIIMSKKEADLKDKLNKEFDTSSTNSTTKTVLSPDYIMTLNSETKKNIDLAKQQAGELVRRFNFKSNRILSFIQTKGTPVLEIKGAEKKLKNLGFDLGFLPAMKGFSAIYLNFILGAGLNFDTPAMLVYEKDQIIKLANVLISFYKWYANSIGLPGLDFEGQKLLNQTSSNKLSMKSLNLKQMTLLKESIHRDQEATDFALMVIREIEAAKKIKQEGDTKL